MPILRDLFLEASRSRWLAERLGSRGFARRAVRRFLPGERLEDALGAAGEFRELGISTVLTRLGENVADAAEARAVADHYVEALEAIGSRGLDAHVSVKLTHLGLDVDRALAERSLLRLVEAAAERGRFVWVDMEGSEYTDSTLELYRSALRAAPRVGVCLQAYLHRTERDLAGLLPLRPAIRLVKGAYQEPPETALRRKSDVDAAYLRLAARLLEAAPGDGVRPAFGTHDPRMIEGVRARAAALAVPPSGFEIQMLYGIRREAQLRLRAEGCAVRVLVSYGDGWFPWYMRRLAERPANVWFVVRSLAAR